VRTLALISGGLDSLLAARFIQSQGVEVVPLHFKIPFCHYDKNKQEKTEALSRLIKEELKEELRQIDIREEFLELLKNPRYGFGSNMNPCIDCKILMLAKAKEMMKETGASFVVTGEVLAQRPMSQHRQALELIEKRSGLEGLLLRPLSAKRLPETIAEREGWVDRNKLLEFSGRTRKPQIELALTLGLKDYPNASGGCLLTDPEFAKRLKDLSSHEGLSLGGIELLRLGRHFRLGDHTKLVVGRNEREDIILEGLTKADDYLFSPPQDLAGPTCLGRGKFTEQLIALSCRITCCYCDLNGAGEADIMVRRIPETEERVIRSLRIEKEALKSFFI
jgi:tRNA-uridine 2-sulfurtransferase